MTELPIKSEFDYSLIVMVIGIVTMLLSLVTSDNVERFFSFLGIFVFGAGIIMWIANSLMRLTGVERKADQ